MHAVLKKDSGPNSLAEHEMKARFCAFRSFIKSSAAKAAARRQSASNYHSNSTDANAAVPTSTILAGGKDDCFNYTSGRWLYNEPLRLKERALSFNVFALQEVAAKAVNQTNRDVTAFRKLAEGGFNRTFLITLTNGIEVIARLPYPVAYPSRFTVASEVATLGLVKLHGIPVPTVLDYSTTKENPVGSEYIIMERVRGTELGDRWFSLADLDRAKLIGRLSQIEQTLFAILLPSSGSIFYKKDLDPSTQTDDIPRTDFCVGPSVEQRWWYNGRDRLETPRGPFRTAEQFLQAGAKKELGWLKAYGQPTFPAREYREFTNYQKSDPIEHITLLERYLQLAPYLAPSRPVYQYLLNPTLRHPDINPRNIFVDQDLQISGLIDWQHCSAVPLFLQAGVPDCFANFGDEESIRLEKPCLPGNLSLLSEAEQNEEVECYRRRHLHFYYYGGAHKFNNIHYQALRLHSTALKQRLCFGASAPWQGNSIPLKAALIEATAQWDTLTAESKDTGTPCPISFSKAGIQECLRISAAQDNVDEMLEMLRGRIGIGTDGWVPLDMFDGAVAENARIKVEVTEDETEERKVVLRHWPFDDHAEDGLS